IPEHLQKGGGPITNEGAGGEVYHTLAYLAESPFDAQELWTGADDGLLHISRDGGENWQNITPTGLGEGLINCIELSTHQAGKAYLVFNRYKFNDFAPHIFVTEDFGATWTEVVKGIAPEAHVRVVRADPERKGLLYAGTETGLYLSYDDGAHWQAFQRNLPIVPITDLKVHQGDLIAATQGRAFWVLDDLSPLRELDYRSLAERPASMYQVRNPYLYGGPRRDSLPDRGANPDFGAVIYYHLNMVADSLSGPAELHILDAAGSMIRAFSSAEKSPQKKLSAKGGLNKLVWNLRMPSVKPIPELLTLGGTASYQVPPGSYQARLIYQGDTTIKDFEVMPDPRLNIETSAYLEKMALMEKLYQSQKEVFKAVKDMRHIKAQVQAFTARMDTTEQVQQKLKAQGEAIVSEIDSLEKTMVQVQQKTFQDVINFPNQIDAKIGHILGTIDGSLPPLTSGQQTRAQDVLDEWTAKEKVIDALLEDKVSAFDQSVRAADIPYIGRRE
ncbi:MAG: WD40/YVTN/BNR-like repeat-containing protein, partial [Bacteroidia bacterium]